MELPRIEDGGFLGSYQQYKDFILSYLWTDLQAEINAWIKDIQGYLENETDVQEIYRFQGRLQSCRQLLTLPERILAAMEIAQDSREEPQEPESIGLADDYYVKQLQIWTMEDSENA